MATLQHTDELYHILEDEICALKILPGEALSENQLCKRFGVSRTPIRSVLQRLEQNRFVQIIPCKGTIVTAIDIGVVDQLIFQRVAVEGMVFRDFVQSCSPMEILAVEHLYNVLLEAAAGRSDPQNFDSYRKPQAKLVVFYMNKKVAAQSPVQRPFSGCASRSRTYDGGVKVPCLTAWRWRIMQDSITYFPFFHKRCAAFLPLFSVRCLLHLRRFESFFGFAAKVLLFPYPAMFLRKVSFAGCVFQKAQSTRA